MPNAWARYLACCAVAAASEVAAAALPPDWLVATVDAPVTLVEHADGTISLTNGLLTRTFALAPGFGTVAYVAEATAARPREHVLRSVVAEATVVLDGVAYAVGGLSLDQNHSAYLRRPITYAVDADAFAYGSHSTSSPEAPVPWEQGRRHAPNASWPPEGLRLDVAFRAPAGATRRRNVTVRLHYELYAGAPLLAKWASLAVDAGAADVVVDRVDVELLATDRRAARILWRDDAAFAEAADAGAVEPVLNATYASGPGVRLGSVDAFARFASFRVFEMTLDGFDVERDQLATHQIVRRLAPWTSENPIFFHLTDASSAGFRRAVDQMADVRFEMVIYGFGSGFRLETRNETHLASVAADVAYAAAKGVEVGGYDLICLDRGHGGYGGDVGDEWARVNDDGSLGVDACFASGWADELRSLALDFLDATGLAMLETDGPYGGGECAATNHSHHRGREDSVYMQTKIQAEFYTELRRRGVFVNQPDDYFYQGGQKTGMGYDENQYSLPRWEDLSVSRQSMFDDTYARTPTQGWMFVPLNEYHGGGESAATSLRLPLYYAGLTTSATLTDSSGAARTVALDRSYAVDVALDMAPRAIEWVVVTAP
ncbi:hypothetical protein JL721_346 [Aureococcus anophagefferens]|nr:hypothetical protein JL721_346 [Aureococcus anophagefferens]